MVFGVCHRVIGNAGGAEDAAQECFLKLAQKASQLRAPITGWLHCVAVRIARDMARQGRARREREQRALAMSRTAEEGVSWEELKPYVDQALSELPDELRQPLIQYYLEGRAQEGIATDLGITQGAVSKRLRRGEQALREALGKLGVATSVAAMTTLLSAHAVEAASPALTASLGKMALAGVRRGGGQATAATTKAAAVAIVIAAAGTAVGIRLRSQSARRPGPIRTAAAAERRKPATRADAARQTPPRGDVGWPNDISGIVTQFRKNRDKLKCAVLSWDQVTRIDGFAREEKYVYGGSYLLRWDGKRILTHYREQRPVRHGEGGPLTLEDKTGRFSYRGHWKGGAQRVARTADWFALTHWAGKGSTDESLLDVEKRKDLEVQFTVVDGEQGKLLKVTTKYKDQKGDGRSEDYYDPSRGCCWVACEWYDDKGRLYMRRTTKVAKVIDDVWFPVVIDSRSIKPEQGKVTLHRHAELDLDECYFNDRSAVRDCAAEPPAEDVCERLNDLVWAFADPSQIRTDGSSDARVASARQVVAGFLAAVRAGQEPKVAPLDADETREIRERLEGRKPAILCLCVSAPDALAAVAPLRGHGGEQGILLFELALRDRTWAIAEIDLRGIENTQERVVSFLEAHPRAVVVPAKANGDANGRP